MTKGNLSILPVIQQYIKPDLGYGEVFSGGVIFGSVRRNEESYPAFPPKNLEN